MNNQNIVAIGDNELEQANGGILGLIVGVAIAVIAGGYTIGKDLAAADAAANCPAP